MFTIKNLLMLIVRNTIISLIFVAISISSIFYINGKISIITDTIVLNHKMEAELKKRSELLETLKQDAQIIEKNDILINNAFIPSNNISEFTNVLDDLAIKNNIIQLYRFETPVISSTSDELSTSTISFSNTISGDFSTISKYLKNFEKLPYFTKIESLNISSQDSKGWVGLSSVTMKATLLTEEIQ
jgi:hypothetical protein